LTGIGNPDALREVIHSREFASIQVPYHLLNPSAGRPMPASFSETNYDHLIDDCVANSVAVLAIRVFAGGALLDAPPSAHTLKTPFFPLELYERDRKRAEQLRARFGERYSMQELALRFVLSDERVTSAIIGFANPEEVKTAAKFASRGPLPPDVLDEIRTLQDHAFV
jgi:L-galactose dehydrogenase/L-glyceraldehyde 3-phosphate reductase